MRSQGLDTNNGRKGATTYSRATTNLTAIFLSLALLTLPGCLSLAGAKVAEVEVAFDDGNLIVVRPDSLDDLGIASVLVRFEDGVTARWAPVRPAPLPLPALVEPVADPE